jgi:hypothetical protein
MKKEMTGAPLRQLSVKEQKQILGGQDDNFWVCVGSRPVFPNHGACKKFCGDGGDCEKQVFE